MGWLFVGMMLLSIQAFSLLYIARQLSKWVVIVQEHDKHLKALNNVNTIHQQHLGLLSRRINDG